MERADPKIHSAESCPEEASKRKGIDHLRFEAAPAHGDINHTCYSVPSEQQV